MRNPALVFPLTALPALCLLHGPGSARATQEAPTGLVVRVEAIALPPTALPAVSGATVAGLLAPASLPGVSARCQGAGAPQVDLSIRGAPFSSSGLTLAGLPLRNPQTEHFQCDLPVPADVFTPLRLLTGLDQFRQSDGHPAGSVALDVAPLTDACRIGGGGGNDGAFASLRLGRTTAVDPQTTLGASTFAEWATLDRTDGYADNDLQRLSAGGQLQARQENGQFDLLGASSWRRFGARGFYGAPASLPSEEEVRETLVTGGAALQQTPDDVVGHVTAAWQKSDDRYWLTRQNPDWYVNHTLSDVASLHGDARTPVARDTAIDWRADADAEWIDGQHTGTLPGFAGLGDHRREHAALAALPHQTIGDWIITAGGSVAGFSDDRPALLPAAGIAWKPVPGRTLSLTYAEAVREPSFTELNYESPGSLGNSGLQRQHTRTVDLSWREEGRDASGGVSLFAEEGRNMVDWLRQVPGGPWVATNLEEVRTLGLLADVAVPLTQAANLTGSYMALAKSCDTPVYASRYVLDYPEQTVRVGGRVRLSPDWTLSVRQEAALYGENPARRGTRVALGATAEVRWRVWRRAGIDTALGVANPWNNRFETYPGQPVAGTRVDLSVQRTW